MHTGVIGERVTTPRSPLGVMATGDAARPHRHERRDQQCTFREHLSFSVLYAVGVRFHTGVRAESVGRTL